MLRAARSYCRGTANRGSTLAVALALAFLIFGITSICLSRVAASYAQIAGKQDRASALYLAEAGVQKAARRLLADRNYGGETGATLPTGAYYVKVTKSGADYVITSTGLADSPFKKKTRKTVQATVQVTGPGSFRIVDWREDP